METSGEPLLRLSVQDEGKLSNCTRASRNLSSSTSETAGDGVSIGSGMELITYVFPDFKAVKYFEKEFVLADEYHIAEVTTASGFEIYLIDQWIRSRKIGSFISVFTGNQESVVNVVKFTVIKKLAEKYPPRFQEYLSELILSHATYKKMTQMGDSPDLGVGSVDIQHNEYLMVTNLNAFPRNLNLIAATHGDSRSAISRYMINSNLRMFYCGGRSLSLLAERVSDSCAGRFRQMYRMNSEAVPADFAILELVNLVQTCLFYYDLLDAEYADGLLCQKTEDAIESWWNLIGLPVFNIKPDMKSGILSSKTVSAIISLTVSVKLRLQMFGSCDVPKDPFDFENFMLSIGQFQKQIGIHKKRKLDLTTLLRLFSYTNANEQAKKMRSDFGNEGMFIKEFNLSPVGSVLDRPNPGSSSVSIPSASVYRRSRIHYSKELKKLTNVVRNTVQERIIYKDYEDDLLPSSLVNKSKLRSKIALKLTDTLTPSDVETTDIDVLVKKCLVGKTLKRLWIGLPAGKGATVKTKEGEYSFSGQPTKNQQPHHHHLKKLVYGNNARSTLYSFVSFKDSVYANLNTPESPRKQGKRRFGFQNRQPQSKLWSQGNLFEDNDGTCHDTVDGQLEVKYDLKREPSTINESVQYYQPRTLEPSTSCFHVLNRRSSFPFIADGIELGLNSLEYVKSDDHKSLSKLRHASFSDIDATSGWGLEIYCSERARIDYVNQTIATMAMETTLSETTNLASQKLEQQFEKTNYELVRLHNICYHMEQRKKNIESDCNRVLEGKMNDLIDNINRMSFRARDLTKKITELEINTEKFLRKVQTGALDRLDALTDSVVNSPKFKKVFKDEDEMKQMYLLLSGTEYDSAHEKTAIETWCFQPLVIYVYQFVLIILQFFKFDRSTMNLERIREQYRMIDPTRQYINRLYKLIGVTVHLKKEDAEENADSLGKKEISEL